jgi:class 3 adenylate cyclase/predicted component of type VI protein secretion system
LRLGLKLVAVNGSQTVAVPAGRTLVVGRSPACDVPIRDLTVSRHHGEVEIAATGLRVRDLGSTNGTYINGSRIGEGVASPGSRVAFGKVAFQVLEDRSAGSAREVEDDTDHLTVVSQLRAQSLTEIASLLAPEAAAAAGRHLRVRGESAAERRAAALALLLEIAKDLSQQGEPARLLDKAARLLLQALRVDRVDILTRGDEEEMVPRVSKVRPGAAAGSVRVPRLAARKAGIERVAVLIAETAPVPATDAMPHFDAGFASGAPVTPGTAPLSSAGVPGGGQLSPERAGAPLTAASPALSAEPAEPPAALGVATGPPTAEPPEAGRPLPTATAAAVALGVARAATEGAQPANGAEPADAAQATDSAPATGGARATGGDQATGGAGAAKEGKAPAAERRGNAICVPLLGMQASVLGLLYVAADEEEALGREELEFLTSFAGIVAVTLENLWLMERARGEAVAQAAYRRHFAPFVAEQVAGQDAGVRLDGERRRVAFLCCEIRGTIDLAEELQPGEIARLLGEFFGEMVDVVFEHGGTLDRLAGTGLTAMWGTPLSRQDDADEAVQAAIDMQRGLERLNGEWGRQGRRTLDIAVGIDLGEVFAGNVGSDLRLEFTAIGRPVERAAALAAGAGAGEVLVTEPLLEALSSPPPAETVPGGTALAEVASGQVLPAAAAPDVVAPAPAAAAAATASGPRPAASRPVYRVDWRTPPTLRQSGEQPQQL